MSLPPSILRHLLGLLDLKCRLTTCSLVHSTWAVAAREALEITVTVSRWRWKQERWESYSGAHMFGSQVRLPHLAVLHLEGIYEHECGYPDACLSGDDVESIARACVGGCLRELKLYGVVDVV